MEIKESVRINPGAGSGPVPLFHGSFLCLRRANADPCRRGSCNVVLGFWVPGSVLGVFGGGTQNTTKYLGSVLGGGCGELHPPRR